jgi:RNA polymerase sigma-70 factor (ECF subfamily)
MTRDVESALVEQAQAGCKDAFSEIWLANLMHLRNFLSKRIRDQEIKEDVEQLTALKAWIKLKQYRNERPFYYWLFSVAMNEWLMVERAAKQDAQRRIAYGEGVAAGMLPAPIRLIEKMDAERDLAWIFKRAERLRPDFRAAWGLIAVGGLSSSEAAAIEGIKPSAIKSRLHRAKQRLNL